MSEEPNTPVSLVYQEARPLRRRKLRRRIILAVCFLCGAVAVWYRHDAIWTDAQFLYWQHQCLTNSPPQDQVIVLQDDVPAMTELQNSDATYGTNRSPLDQAYFIEKSSPCWDRYESLIETSSALARPLSGSGVPSSPTVLFMHGRRSPHGHKRLVVVILRFFDLQADWMIDPRAFKISNFQDGSTKIGWSDWAGLGLRGSTWKRQPPPLAKAKFFAGQIDPTDESRFTIQYSIDGVPGTIEGQLQDDNIAHLVARDVLNGGRLVYFPDSDASQGSR